MRIFILAFLTFISLVANAAAAAFTAGYTNLSFTPGHGTQIYYVGNGVEYLWYPGNQRVVKGNWRKSTAKNSLCFNYGPNSHNPVTGHRGDGWQCGYLTLVEAGILEQVKGDIFGLSQRSRVPFRLAPSRTSLKKIARKLNIGLSGSTVPTTQGMKVQPGFEGGERLPSCEEALAMQDKNRMFKITAANIYAGGRYNGKPCTKADYVKAFQLFAEAGMQKAINHYLKDLRNRAQAGNAASQAHLRKLKRAGMID